MKCDECPAAWAERDIMTACGVEHGEYGCLIKGMNYGGEGERCHRTKEEVEKKLEELKRYANGEIKRPKWVLKRFLRDLTSQMDTVECGLPGFPKLWQPKENDREDDYSIFVKPLYGSTDWHYQREADKREANERLETLKKQIANLKKCEKTDNRSYQTGFLCALSVVEGMIAEINESEE